MPLLFILSCALSLPGASPSDHCRVRCHTWLITLSTQLLVLVFGRRSRAPTCSLVCARVCTRVLCHDGTIGFVFAVRLSIRLLPIVHPGRTRLPPAALRKPEPCRANVPVADARRIEVVATGLLLWHGSQLALDATIVSPLTHSKPTLNSPAPGDAASSLSASRLAAGLALRPCSCCACSRDIGRRLFLPHPDLPRSPAGLRAGPGSWLSQLMQRAFAASLLELPPPPSSEKAQSLSCTNFSLRRAGTMPSRRCPPPAAPALQCRAHRHRDLRRDFTCG